MIDKTPTYNLKAVVRETGLKPDTLRAWERRYGVPTPERTDSGHRLYSQHDIDTLKWLLDRQSEGMSISRAIELWSRLESEGVDPLQATITPGAHRHLDLRTAPAPIEQPALTNSDVVTGLRDAWVNACLAFDEFHAEQLLAQAFAFFPTEVVCVELIQKGLAQIGDTAALEAIVDAVVAANPDPVAQYRAGKMQTFGFLVGQVMKASKGKANPAVAGEILKARIG